MFELALGAVVLLGLTAAGYFAMTRTPKESATREPPIREEPKDTVLAPGVTQERLDRHLTAIDAVVNQMIPLAERIKKKRNTFHWKLRQLNESIRKLRNNVRQDPSDLDALGPFVPTLQQLLIGANEYANLASYDAPEVQAAKEQFEGDVLRAITAFDELLVKVQSNNQLNMDSAIATVNSIYPSAKRVDETTSRPLGKENN